MKKELLVKTSAIITGLILLLGMNGVLFSLFVNEKLDLTQTYIASKDIAPRSEIKESDLLEIKIPKDYLMDYAYTNKNDIVGKYTEIQGMIPAGSVFYKNMLFDKEDIPDQASIQLKNGQTAYALEIDLSKLGSILVGNRIDIYVTIKDAEKTISGYLIRNARVIAMKDHNGISLQDENSTKIPYYVEIAISYDQIPYLTTAETNGEIRLFMASNQSDIHAEAQLDQTSDIYTYFTKNNKEEKSKDN